jgi:acetoacetyl-CoA synthetase
MPILWRPDAERIANANLTAFRSALTSRDGRAMPGYSALHDFSVREPGTFWRAVWEWSGVIGVPGERDVVDVVKMPGARFLPDARLNFAENLLRRRDEEPAIIAVTERGGERRVTWRELAMLVAQVAGRLRADGVREGDRVAGYMANVPEAVIAALGAAAIGAVWSSCSPDFGVQGVLDRFGQIEPTVLFAVEGYDYGGKSIDCRLKVAEMARALPSVRRVVLVPVDQPRGSIADLPHARLWAEWVGESAPVEPAFVRRPFNHPLYIMYSSGTTGVPKCIVHGAGGTLLQHVKEHRLQCDVKPGDRVFYFTTCGWMMWNWLVTALASGATIVLYDGSPFQPSGLRLFDLADALQITLFGTSAKFIDAVQKAGLEPKRTHSLRSLRTITSTGSPLVPESFDFVYGHIKADVHLASISGGTDIISCFVGGDPTAPVYRGEIQAPGLGMDVDVFDEHGEPVRGRAGDLVCKTPFPSMPVGFWHDPDGAKYRAAYFERFPGVWCHGDWAEITAHGGIIIYGRSDATLNPGGVRIGTAEIYRQVERLPEVVESLAVGQHWQGDERVLLFVRLREGVVLDDAIRLRINAEIRANTSPRHVPALILQVADIPRTKSGKIVELAVRDVIHGRPVKNRDALANPEALDLFRDRPELLS